MSVHVALLSYSKCGQQMHVKKKPYVLVWIIAITFCHCYAIFHDCFSGYSVKSNEKKHIFKPVSVQAMWLVKHKS